MDDIIALIQGKRYISVLDAAKFFYQWRVRRDHRGRICVVTHRGQEMFHFAIMGFCNSVPYVQRQMDLLLKEFVEFCRAYLDDIVAASDTFDLHIEHLTLVLEVLEKHSVSLEPKKAYIAFPQPTDQVYGNIRCWDTAKDHLHIIPHCSSQNTQQHTKELYFLCRTWKWRQFSGNTKIP